MEVKELANKIFEIKNLLEKNDGISLFVNLRIKRGRKLGFERWLEVELCGILSHDNEKVEPEACNKKIDILLNEEWAISLKDHKTKFYHNKNVKRKTSIFHYLNELEKKPYSDYNKACLVFLTFPSRETTNDNIHIENELKKLQKTQYHKDFTFKNNIKGRVWFIER